MKKSLAITGVVAFLLCSSVSAQNSGFGLGIILGEPTGISAKAWTTNTTAFDGAIAWSTGREDAVYVHMDYLIHNFNIIQVQRGQLPFYFGLGVRARLANNARVGIRVPLGLDYLFARNPLDIFFEIVPVLNLVPDTNFGVDAGIGIRYFF
ncbi:MAG TPA: DUF3996 domain-containing protein [Balneolales bacterium]|nr:DUF3996 domain-containing protein [Balneolales bacterium]